MSLIRKNLTPRLLAANRANSRKSTGPRTELGKSNASRNAAKHLIYAKVSPSTMKELGEDPADFEKLRESLLCAFDPQDGFEEMLVGEMAENRWRRQRLLRAEAGIMANQRRSFVFERKVDVIDARKEPATRRMELTDDGLAGRSGSYRNSAEIVHALVRLKESIERAGFREDDRGWLQYVYGSASSQHHYLLLEFDQRCESPGTSEEQELGRQAYLQELESEIAFYRKFMELYRARDLETPESVADAELLPEQETQDKIQRYEAALERQFERKVQLLVAWRKEKGEALPAEASLVGGGEAESWQRIL